MLSSRTRRRGSKSPSHSGIVTIFFISLSTLQTIRSSNPAKRLKEKAYVFCLHVCNITLKFTVIGCNQHAICVQGAVCVENLNCKPSLKFKLCTATTHTDFKVNRLLTLILGLLHMISTGRKIVKLLNSQLLFSSAAKDSLQIAPNL